MSFSMKGIFAPIVTPFKKNGEVNYTEMAKIARFIMDGGVDGILSGGTNGEFANLTIDERLELLKILIDTVGKEDVIFNVTSLNLKDLNTLIHGARSLGVEAVTATSPYFHRYDETALYLYFSKISELVAPMSLYLYNITGMTQNPISALLVKKLCENCPNIKGIKDSSMDFMTLLEYRNVTDSTFEIVTGNDAQVLYGLLAGANGGLIASASVFPSIAKDIYRHFENGDIDRARYSQNKVMNLRTLFREVMPVMAHKEALALQGFDTRNARYPFRELNDVERERVKKGLKELALI